MTCFGRFLICSGCRNHISILPLALNSGLNGIRTIRSGYTETTIKFFTGKALLVEKRAASCTLYRWKHSKKSTRAEIESDSDDEEEQSDDVDEADDKISKVISTTVSSLRVDLILKAGLGIARNKAETLFYESKIRVNGEKIMKKSLQCQVGDEVDMVRGPSPDNPKFLVVARVELLSAAQKGEKLAVKLRRFKSLVIENYEEPWKSEQEEQ